MGTQKVEVLGSEISWCVEVSFVIDMTRWAVRKVAAGAATRSGIIAE